jgi:hypothetical protein
LPASRMRLNKIETLAEYAPEVKKPEREKQLTDCLDEVLVPFDLALSSRVLSPRAGAIHR